MQRLILLFYLVISGLFASGQIHVGVKAGVGIKDISLTSSNELADSNFWSYDPGFAYHFGVVLTLRPSSTIGGQVEVLFSNKGSGAAQNNLVNDPANYNYITVPFLLRLRLFDHVRLQLGPEFGFLLSQTEDSFVVPDAQNLDVGIIGGIDFQLGDRLILGGRYALGLTNLWDINFLDINGGVEGTVQARNQVGQVYLQYNLITD